MRKSFLNIAIFVLIAFSLSAIPRLNKGLDEATLIANNKSKHYTQDEAITQATKLIMRNPAIGKKQDQHLSITKEGDKFNIPMLRYMPDATNQQFSVLPNGSKEDIFVNVYNSLGNMIKVCRVMPEVSEYILPLDGLTQGIYLIKLINGSKVIETRKIIIKA